MNYLSSWIIASAISGWCWNYGLGTSFQISLPWYIDFALGFILPPIGILFALLSWAISTFGQLPM